ncbi:glucosamine-6-phosphate deaminase [Radiobacillus sp. PE A8.2]|uniref:glucosamine-6-phosphate deaminase n=1 Tax=Radiobacillus sp. PE A8.2 TaxID=3380349 RepID=UPI00388E67B8
MELYTVEDYETMSREVCAIICQKMSTLSSPVLGLATGSTPVRLYEMLVEQYKAGAISFSNTHTFNLDEYIGLLANDPNSYRYFMDKHLFNYIDIPNHQVNIPNGKAKNLEDECMRYEESIQAHDGIDLQILGLGMNGHIGFNEPGTSFNSSTHIVELQSSTRKANARFFNTIDEVPTKAITMGISTIMKSKEIVLMVSGENKAIALQELLNKQVSEQFPASILHQHSNVKVIADKAALSSKIRS